MRSWIYLRVFLIRRLEIWDTLRAPVLAVWPCTYNGAIHVFSCSIRQSGSSTRPASSFRFSPNKLDPGLFSVATRRPTHQRGRGVEIPSWQRKVSAEFGECRVRHYFSWRTTFMRTTHTPFIAYTPGEEMPQLLPGQSIFIYNKKNTIVVLEFKNRQLRISQIFWEFFVLASKRWLCAWILIKGLLRDGGGGWKISRAVMHFTTSCVRELLKN